jgi:hypothetical protein
LSILADPLLKAVVRVALSPRVMVSASDAKVEIVGARVVAFVAVEPPLPPLHAVKKIDIKTPRTKRNRFPYY